MVQYNLWVFLPQNEAAPRESVDRELRAALLACGAQPVEERSSDENLIYTGFWDSWALNLCYNLDPDLEWGERPREPPWDRVLRCTRMVELWSDPDPDMDYFNTHIEVQMELEKRFPDVIIIHPESGEIM